MKAPTDKAATRRVLAGIDAVLRERTAAAVERTLTTASPAHGPYPCHEASQLAYDVCCDTGVIPRTTNCLDHCFGDPAACESDGTYEHHATPGMTIAEGHGPEYHARPLRYQRRDYAPWVVSPHLFGGEQS